MTRGRRWIRGPGPIGALRAARRERAGRPGRRLRPGREATLLALACLPLVAVAVAIAARDQSGQRAGIDPVALDLGPEPAAADPRLGGGSAGAGGPGAGGGGFPEGEEANCTRRSQPLGLPHRGHLAGGVRLPTAGEHHFTWDPIYKRVPNRPWRMWATSGVVCRVLAIARQYREENPDAPRVAIGDLSRPRGGHFGPRFGAPGHASHQNGLDVDIYYPRLDGRESAPFAVPEVDLRLAQDLVDRFVAAGARYVFVGPSTPLRGPRGVVQPLPFHDNHLHVRFQPAHARPIGP